MRFIKWITIHCSAGFSLITDIEKTWYTPKSKGGLGWKNPGYHIIIYVDGTTWYVTQDGSYSKDETLWSPQKITNGVGGFNANNIHICYIGGINKKTGKAEDTRTDLQKESILSAFTKTFVFLKNYQEIDKIKIRGHRDFSPDLNNNNKIEARERLKECPSFEVRDEYWWLEGSEALNSKDLL